MKRRIANLCFLQIVAYNFTDNHNYLILNNNNNSSSSWLGEKTDKDVRKPSRQCVSGYVKSTGTLEGVHKKSQPV